MRFVILKLRGLALLTIVAAGALVGGCVVFAGGFHG